MMHMLVIMWVAKAWITTGGGCGGGALDTPSALQFRERIKPICPLFAATHSWCTVGNCLRFSETGPQSRSVRCSEWIVHRREPVIHIHALLFAVVNVSDGPVFSICA